MTGNLFDNATLRFWHGGKIKVVNSGELLYVGGRCRTFQDDPDQLCVWHIMELACKTRGYTKVNSVYYLIKGKSLHDGLRRVEKDASVLEMGQLAMKSKDQNSDTELSTVLPKAEHRHCARHVYAHWHKHFRGDELKLKFWKIAKAYSLADYNDAMAELEELNADAAYNPKCFCRAFMDPSIKSDAITNNMVETFNGYIINARTKHLIYMMEDINVDLMQRLVNKRKEMEKQSTGLCPSIQSMLKKEKEKASMCDVLPSSESIFNVRYYLYQLIVNLQLKTCTSETYVDDCCKTEVYLKCYAGFIPPIEGERHWPRVEMKVDPPPIKVGLGRPRKSRIKDLFEDSKKPGKLSRHGFQGEEVLAGVEELCKAGEEEETRLQLV
ncbi:Long-chain-fatty-acid--CoA ligase [Bienertia sinuspersici]